MALACSWLLPTDMFINLKSLVLILQVHFQGVNQHAINFFLILQTRSPYTTQDLTGKRCLNKTEKYFL